MQVNKNTNFSLIWHNENRRIPNTNKKRQQSDHAREVQESSEALKAAKEDVKLKNARHKELVAAGPHAQSSPKLTLPPALELGP